MENPVDRREHSVWLSRELDDMGLSTELVAFRILLEVSHETEMNTMSSTSYDTVVGTGSEAEGIVSSFHTSDIDMLNVYNSVEVHDPHDLKEEHEEALLHDNIEHYIAIPSPDHPGFVDMYCKDPITSEMILKPSYTVVAVFADELASPMAATVFKSLTNMYAGHTNDPHGPAIDVAMNSNNSLIKEFDLVRCFRMIWARSANEWTTRRRQFGWPSYKLMHALVKKGCHVVPVGHPDRRSEWRLSFSVAEKALVWTFNDVQRKCYFLLKQLCKDVIQEAVPGVLCSYFMKTLMFWMKEETDQGQWCTDNLLGILGKCLCRLRLWIDQSCIPNYFVCMNNMVAHKLTPEIRKQLLCVLDSITRDLWGHLSRCKAIRHTNKSPTVAAVYATSFQHLFVTLFSEHYLKGTQERIYIRMCLQTPSETIIEKLQSKLKRLRASRGRGFTKYLESLIESNIGSLYHAMYIESCAHGNADLELEERAHKLLYKTSGELPGFGYVRLANFFCLSRNYNMALKINHAFILRIL
jgi:hypothetical protein